MKPEEISHKKVLVASLNWGMGHVSRTIAIINRLIKQDNKLFFVGNEAQLQIVKTYFPEITVFNLDDYPFRFGDKGNFTLDLLKTIKPLFKRFKKEQRDCNELTKKLKIDIVISDHRYGFKSKCATNVFVTHQINLPLSWWQYPFQLIHKRLINSFDWIWIPDTEDSQFAGKLSNMSNNPKYIPIGIISRFELYPKQIIKTINSTIIISGPIELAKEFLKNQIEHFKKEKKEKPTIICSTDIVTPEIDLVDFKLVENWIDADSIILKSKKIISRSGYSTIMDIAYLNCESDLTPTKGQKEQEYLFKIWKKNKIQVNRQ